MREEMKKLWKEHGMLLALTSCVILLQTVVGLLLWNRLPDQIATHFDMNNEPNGWSSKAFTVLGMPLVLLALHWICVLISCSQRHTGLLSGKMKRLVLLVVPATSLLTMTLTYGYALGAAFDIGRIVWFFVGAVFAVIGNYLPKIRRNYTVGIKLPWTMADDENWNRTHRFAAPVWVIGGLLLMVCGLIGSGPMIPIAAIAAVVMIPIGYSLVLHVHKQQV